MKKYIKITYGVLLILYFHGSCAMVARASQTARQRLTTQQLAANRALLQTQTRHMTQPIRTAPIAKASSAPAPSTGLFAKMQNNWYAFKNWFTSKTPAPSPIPSTAFRSKLPAITQPLSMPVPKGLIEQPVSSIDDAAIAQLETAQSLSEMGRILKNNETKEYNKQKDLLNISNEQWLALLKKEQEDFIWIKNNCFKNKNIATDDRSKIPQEIHNTILQCLKTAEINPQSVRLVWQKINTPDAFGHKTIVTNGPIVNNNTTSLENIPTITFDPDKVSQLSPEELSTEIYHAITHLTQGHHNQLKNLEDIVGTEKFTKYTQSSDGKNYLNTLEEIAYFLMPIQNPEIAKITEKTYLSFCVDYFLNTVKPYMDQFKDIKVNERICSRPSEEIIQFFATVKSLANITEICAKKRQDIVLSLGFEKHELDEYNNALTKMIMQESSKYKLQSGSSTHSKQISPALLELVKKLLIQFKIEPSSINIEPLAKEYVSQGAQAAIGVVPFVEGNSVNFKTTNLFLSPTLNSNNAYDITTILHEIGHLINLHGQKTTLFMHLCNKKAKRLEKSHSILKEFENKARTALIKLNDIEELEADLFASATNPNVAKLNLLVHYQQIKHAHGTPESNNLSKRPSPVHMSIVERFYAYNKIVQLHDLEKR